MNPFEQHADNMRSYEELLAIPIGDKPAPSVQYPLDAGGRVTAGTKTYAATVGQFVIRQVLSNGGFSPRLMGQAIIRKSLLPDGTAFHTGHKLIATQAGGSVRVCQIDDIEDTFTEWRLNLWDVNQGA